MYTYSDCSIYIYTYILTATYLSIHILTFTYLNPSLPQLYPSRHLTLRALLRARRRHQSRTRCGNPSRHGRAAAEMSQCFFWLRWSISNFASKFFSLWKKNFATIQRRVLAGLEIVINKVPPRNDSFVVKRNTVVWNSGCPDERNCYLWAFLHCQTSHPNHKLRVMRQKVKKKIMHPLVD